MTDQRLCREVCGQVTRCPAGVKGMSVTITYPGFLQTVTREFDTEEQATLWLRKVGKYERASIIPKALAGSGRGSDGRIQAGRR